MYVRSEGALSAVFSLVQLVSRSKIRTVGWMAGSVDTYGVLFKNHNKSTICTQIYSLNVKLDAMTKTIIICALKFIL